VLHEQIERKPANQLRQREMDARHGCLTVVYFAHVMRMMHNMRI